MVRSCDAYLATGAHRPTPHHHRAVNFQLAFGTRIGQRLSDARDEAKQEVTKSRTAAPRTAIALRNKEIELRNHYRTESKARGTAFLLPRQGIRRPRDEPVTTPDAGSGWVPAPSYRVRGPGCRGERPRQSTFSGLCVEEFVRTLFDRAAAAHGSRAIDFFGDPITLPPEARFASMESVQRCSTRCWRCRP